jgi:hypothetical protein
MELSQKLSAFIDPTNLFLSKTPKRVIENADMQVSLSKFGW